MCDIDYHENKCCNSYCINCLSSGIALSFPFSRSNFPSTNDEKSGRKVVIPILCRNVFLLTELNALEASTSKITSDSSS